MNDETQGIFQACLAYFLSPPGPLPALGRQDDPVLHEALVGGMERLWRRCAARWLASEEGQQWAAQWEESIAWRDEKLKAGEAVAAERRAPQRAALLPVPTDTYEAAMAFKRMVQERIAQQQGDV